MKKTLLFFILILSISTVSYAFDNEQYIKQYNIWSYVYDIADDDNQYRDIYNALKEYTASDNNTLKQYAEFLLYEVSDEDDYGMLAFDIIRVAVKDYLNHIKTSSQYSNYTGNFKNQFGYVFNPEAKVQLACSDDLINGKIKEEDKTAYYEKRSSDIIALRNRALLKAIDMLHEFISWDQVEQVHKNISHLYIGFANLIIDGLNNYTFGIENNWTKYMELSDYDSLLSDIEYMTGETYLEYAADMASMVEKLVNLNREDISILDIYNTAYENNFLKFIAIPYGFFNIYNDGVYEKVEIKKVNEYSIIHIYEKNYLNYENKNLYARYYINDNAVKADSKKYPAFHCTNNVYKGDLYLINYLEITYIINANEYNGKINKIEVRSPALFNTEYSKLYDSSSTFDISTDDGNKQAKLHQISNMGSFSYRSNILYEDLNNQEPQSPIGDIENIKDERGKRIYPSEVLLELNIDNFKNDENRKKEIKYIEYLQKYTKKQLIIEPNMLMFYKIKNGSKNIIIASAVYMEDEKYKEILFVLDDDLKILDKKTTNKIDNYLSTGNNYRTIIKENNGSIFIGFTKKDNTIFVASVQDSKMGSGTFQIYNQNTLLNNELLHNIIDTHDVSNFIDITKTIDIDCYETQDMHEKYICSHRPLITAYAYISKKYRNKITDSFPQNIQDLYNMLYNDMKEEYKKCEINNYKCIMNNIMKYEQYFIR